MQHAWLHARHTELSNTSHVTRHTSHGTEQHVTRHTSHVTRNRGTRHMSHVTRHTSRVTPGPQIVQQVCAVQPWLLLLHGQGHSQGLGASVCTHTPPSPPFPPTSSLITPPPPSPFRYTLFQRAADLQLDTAQYGPCTLNNCKTVTLAALAP